jgi:hypothetical protein
VPDLRIIDDALWEAVKARQTEIDAEPGVQAMKASRFWERRRAVHMLTGRAFCGACGGPMAAVGRDYLACSNARKLGSCDERKGIRRSDHATEVAAAGRVAPLTTDGSPLGAGREDVDPDRLIEESFPPLTLAAMASTFVIRSARLASTSVRRAGSTATIRSSKASAHPKSLTYAKVGRTRPSRSEYRRAGEGAHHIGGICEDYLPLECRLRSAAATPSAPVGHQGRSSK